MIFKSRKFFQVLTLVLLGITAAYFLITAAFFYGSRYYYGWKLGRDYQQFEQGMLNYLKNDTFGGQTPLKTYEMFLAALRDKNIDKASKYFYWQNQVKEKEKLEQIKADGELEKYIADLPDWKDLKEEEYWDQDGKRYSWEIYKEAYIEKLPAGNGKYIEKEWSAGKYKYYLTFQLNKEAQIWKIYSL